MLNIWKSDSEGTENSENVVARILFFRLFISGSICMADAVMLQVLLCIHV